MSQKAPLHKT